MSEHTPTQRAALLARCSSEANVCSQIIALKQAAAGKFLVEEDDIYGDHISGASSLSERPELNRLLQNIETGRKKYDIVLVQDASRIGRTPEQVQEVAGWFAEKNILLQFQQA
jgi:DNA invertase Pin-like site-specific DNA recombinase